MSLRRVRSPEAPKMTSTHGSGVRRTPRPSRRGFAVSLKVSTVSMISPTMALERSEVERIYHERYLGFRNALATVTGSYDAAHDAVQEGFARALAKRGDFRGGSPEAWIWTIAYRCALER